MLVYARDESEPEKQPLAAEWIKHLWSSGSGRLSGQVLAEYYVTVTEKLRPGLDRTVARDEVRDLQAWRPAQLDAGMLDRAWSIQDRFRIPWWDALIVAAAQVSGCLLLLSEDFQDGQVFDAVRVVNPFLHSPPAPEVPDKPI